jgi:hypothetical protein
MRLSCDSADGAEGVTPPRGETARAPNAPAEVTLSAFSHSASQPTDASLRATLGEAFPIWTRLIDDLGRRLAPVNTVWGSSGKSTGWGLRVRCDERIILYMTPQRGQFLVSFALGARAVEAAAKARLPAALTRTIATAPQYAEGRGVRIEVRSARQIPGIVKLGEVKRSN